MENNLLKLGKRPLIGDLKRDWQKYVMLSIPVLLVLVFSYLPMYGVLLVFKQYNVFKGFFASPWIGFDNFVRVFSLPRFGKVVFNTLFLNLMGLATGFPLTIIFALAINEMKRPRIVRFIQTVSYLPHFLSWVVIYGIFYQLCAPRSGLLNQVVMNTMHILGLSSGDISATGLPFLTDKVWWVGTYLVSGLWEGIGWGSIIYIATIAGVNPELYEAAVVDGCNRWKKMWHITLPSIKPTVVVMLVLSIGSIVSIGFEKPYLFSNPMVQDIGEVISTYVFNVGLGRGDFDAANVVGLAQSVVSGILVITVNSIAKLLGEDGLW